MKHSLIVYIAILALVTALCGCRGTRPMVGPAWKQEMFTRGPEGTPTFKAGWRDGCESATAATSRQFQRLYYDFKMDVAAITNDEYYGAWNNGFGYCHKYLFQYFQKQFSN